MEIEDEPRPGRSVSKTSEENTQLVKSIIDEDPHVTYDNIEAETSLSHGTISTITHAHLKLRKITSRWVHHKLKSDQKQQTVNFFVKI